MTKCEYDLILQGNFGYGWDDLYYCETKKEAKQKLKEYQKNEEVPYRVIKRKHAI